MLISRIEDDRGRALSVISQEDDGVFLIAMFPASEAIGNHGPSFGNHPDDVEIIIVVINKGLVPKFRQMPRFGSQSGIRVPGKVRKTTRFGRSFEADVEAIKKFREFVHQAIISKRIEGELAYRLANALGLKH